MSDTNDKMSKKKLKKFEKRSDKRTADYVVRQLEDISSQLNDLIPDMQTFSKYCDISVTAFCLQLLDGMKKRYEKISEGNTWKDED